MNSPSYFDGLWNLKIIKRQALYTQTIFDKDITITSQRFTLETDNTSNEDLKQGKYNIGFVTSNRNQFYINFSVTNTTLNMRREGWVLYKAVEDDTYVYRGTDQLSNSIELKKRS